MLFKRLKITVHCLLKLVSQSLCCSHETGAGISNVLAFIPFPLSKTASVKPMKHPCALGFTIRIEIPLLHVHDLAE